MEMSTFELNLKGSITIISGFPGIGKTTAMNNLRFHPGFYIEDYDSGSYKRKVKKIHPDISTADLDAAYVQSIVSEYERLKADQMINPNKDCAYVLFVSAHDSVRWLMSESGLQFVYVFPDKNSLPNVIAAAEQRYNTTVELFGEDSDEAQVNMRAVDFLKSNAAAASIERSSSGADAGAYSGQELTLAMPFNTDPGHRVTMYELLLEHTEFSPEYLEENRLDASGAVMFGEGMAELLDEIHDYSHYSRRKAVGTDGFPLTLKSKKGYATQAGIDQYGRIIEIHVPKNPVRKISSHMTGFTMESLLHAGNIGLDSIVLTKINARIIRNFLAALMQEGCTSDVSRLQTVYGIVDKALSGYVQPFDPLLQDFTADEKKDEKEESIDE